MHDLGCRTVVQNFSYSSNTPDSQNVTRNIETVHSSETLVLIYETPQYNISAKVTAIYEQINSPFFVHEGGGGKGKCKGKVQLRTVHESPEGE
jgi:hypothetical protein